MEDVVKQTDKLTTKERRRPIANDDNAPQITMEPNDGGLILLEPADHDGMRDRKHSDQRRFFEVTQDLLLGVVSLLHDDGDLWTHRADQSHGRADRKLLFPCFELRRDQARECDVVSCLVLERIMGKEE